MMLCRFLGDQMNMLHEDMSECFEDLLSMEILDWIINSFSETEKVGVMEEELTELQNYTKSFNCRGNCCPALWTVVKKFPVAFPTSCLSERDFNVVIQLLSKQRNKLRITNCGDLRLLLRPAIGKLV